MAPRNIGSDTLPVSEEDFLSPDEVAPVVTPETHQQKRPPMKIVWRNVIWFILLHLFALYGLYLLPFVHPLTWLWTIFIYVLGALGITAGAHRLWAHKSYKAKLPLRIFLAFCNSIAFQNDVIEWATDHRTHHKYSETDADPHNATRGFFFAHMGWLLVRKHPDVKAKGRLLDYSDLHSDPVCIFQRKVYVPSVLLLTFLIPSWIPYHYWGEDAVSAIFVCAFFRYTLSLNITWCVNSAAHMWGNKPYNKHINPVENIFVTFGAIGEGFHNYHHTFPGDYSTSEFGWKLNLTTLFIDLMTKLGQAYDKKKMSSAAVFKRKQRTGDGSKGFGYFEGPVEESLLSKPEESKSE